LGRGVNFKNIYAYILLHILGLQLLLSLWPNDVALNWKKTVCKSCSALVLKWRWKWHQQTIQKMNIHMKRRKNNSLEKASLLGQCFKTLFPCNWQWHKTGYMFFRASLILRCKAIADSSVYTIYVYTPVLIGNYLSILKKH
jgi:hypothetical protein